MLAAKRQRHVEQAIAGFGKAPGFVVESRRSANCRGPPKYMQVTVKLPDEIAEGLGGNDQIPRRVVEALVLQRYLAEEISLDRLAELLGLSQADAEVFLDHNNARLPYTREMLEEDRRNLTKAFGAR